MKDLILNAIQWLKNVISTIIKGVLNFFTHVVKWFKSLNLNAHKDVPFIANADSEQFRQMLKKAPTKNVGIFQGVYDLDTDSISHYEYLEADDVDSQTSEVLGDGQLVVLK